MDNSRLFITSHLNENCILVHQEGSWHTWSSPWWDKWLTLLAASMITLQFVKQGGLNLYLCVDVVSWTFIYDRWFCFTRCLTECNKNKLDKISQHSVHDNQHQGMPFEFVGMQGVTWSVFLIIWGKSICPCFRTTLDEGPRSRDQWIQAILLVPKALLWSQGL
jgi:hypothetical protein